MRLDRVKAPEEQRGYARKVLRLGHAPSSRSKLIAGTADPRREAELERALVAHVQAFLLELGRAHRVRLGVAAAWSRRR